MASVLSGVDYVNENVTVSLQKTELEARKGLLIDIQLSLSTVQLMWEDDKILLNGRLCLRLHYASCFNRYQSTAIRFDAYSTMTCCTSIGSIYSIYTVCLVRGMKAPLKSSSTPYCRKSDLVFHSEIEHEEPRISLVETLLISVKSMSSRTTPSSCEARAAKPHYPAAIESSVGRQNDFPTSINLLHTRCSPRGRASG